MGVKKTTHTIIEEAKENFQHLLETFTPLIKPYFGFTGKLDISENDPIYDTTGILAWLLNYNIIVDDPQAAKLFCADDVMPKQIIMEEDGLMKYWGFIYWLQTPPDYEINKSGQDPFYCEMRMVNNSVQIEVMKCGDYEKTNLGKTWWFELALDWIYVFEELETNA